MTKRALLLGAGFSYDAGMPLAKDFTKNFFKDAKPSFIKAIFDQMKKNDPYGKGRPIDPSTIDVLYEIYLKHYNNKTNYETFLKSLQDYQKSRHAQSEIDSCHYIFGFYRAMIVELFLKHQLNSLPIYALLKQYYSAIDSYLSDNEELWIFSLNHDLLIESICLDNLIPLSFGYTDKVEYPISNFNFDKKIDFRQISKENYTFSNSKFFHNDRGINLVKMHGGLNEFETGNTGEFFTVVNHNGETSTSYMTKTFNVMKEMKYFLNGEHCRSLGDLIVSDINGKMDFLRLSILTGGYKYQETVNPKPEEAKLNLMDSVLENIEELTIIGYGFGDTHINNRLSKAMYKNENLKIMVVDPSIDKTPELLKPFDYKLRIRRFKGNALEWMDYNKKQIWSPKEYFKLLNEVRKKRELIIDDAINKLVTLAKKIIEKITTRKVKE